jgi:hypothetical protein
MPPAGLVLVAFGSHSAARGPASAAGYARTAASPPSKIAVVGTRSALMVPLGSSRASVVASP